MPELDVSLSPYSIAILLRMHMQLEGDSPDRWLSRPKHTSVARTDGRGRTDGPQLCFTSESFPALPQSTASNDATTDYMAGRNRVNNSPSLRGSNLFVTPRSRTHARPSNTIERR